MKKHWTQTEKGRKKMSAISRAKWVAKRKTKHQPGGPDGAEEKASVAYAFGYTQAWLHSYANSVDLSATAVAYGVGELLCRASRRKVVGA